MLSLTGAPISAQSFVDLTSSQMRIDTLLPKVSHFFALPQGYQDSTYSVQLLYPEYTPLTREQRKAYRRLTGTDTAPATPTFEVSVFQERKQGTLGVDFTPIVMKDNRLCFISSFMPQLTATANTAATAQAKATTTRADNAETAQVYAGNSVLREGIWAKIRVSATGIHRLTAETIRQAGFSDISKVKVYGYGGALIPDKLTQDYLREHDDLKEIATCQVGGDKYFYAQGPVSWDSKAAQKRTRNFYSDYGYYFITEASDAPASCTEEELLQQVTAANDAFHFLHENDHYAWAQLGRNLFDATEIKAGRPLTVNAVIPAGNDRANVQVAVSAGAAATFKVTCGTRTSTGVISLGEYDKAKVSVKQFTITDLDVYPKDADGATLYPITIEALNASTVLRLDYVSAYFATPAPPKALASGGYPAAEYVHKITNQNLHADTPVDLLIIIPTSQKLREQAEALAECHRTNDNMTVRILPADELYNEFSSGTPDMSAYRRYLKMFYDKASDESGMIKYVLLFGDAVWDNRMITLPAKLYSPDDYLLCYETEDSYNMIHSIAADDFITVLQDNKTIHTDNNEERDRTVQFDVAVGRIPVVQSGQANNVVDKITHYITSSPSGAWQNEIMFIGDDGDGNSHMRDINSNADDVIERSPGYHVKKMMLDAYERVSSSSGNTYPTATTEVKKQQNNGALIMNYGGHASWTLLTNEKLLVLSDFSEFKGNNYSLWFTAACETMPFDGTTNTLGEAALLNPNGGAAAFCGTVRTVLGSKNTQIDKLFMKYVLDYDTQGEPLSIGDALRRAKNDLVKGNTYVGTDLSVNKHHYTILGDPAMRLALPKHKTVVDAINAKGTDEVQTLKGNSIVNIKGHIESRTGEAVSDFNGTATILVRDSRQTINCRGNDYETSEIFTYSDRTGTLYKGTCTVTNGKFEFSFKMPRDISDDGGTGLITIHAIDPTLNISANGECGSFSAQGWEDSANDFTGPSIYAYLNTPSFSNGGTVGRTPFFVAEVSDKDGISATGASIGHNLELIIDGEADRTYDLDANFQFDSGSYTSGQTYYVLPTLEPGNHSLTFKAWDLLGNSNTVSLDFCVIKGMAPEISSVAVTPNPVKDVATFHVTHDLQGSEATVQIDIIDPSGRIVDMLQWSDIFSESSPTTTYRWTPSGIAQGLYLYRVRLSCDGSDFVSKTQKLIIAQ